MKTTIRNGRKIAVSRGVIKDLTGQRFGRLVVLSMTDERIKRRVVWECRCDCGNICRVMSGRLLSGRKASCGCYMREAAGKSRIKHHMSGQPLHVVWQGMIQRCTNKHHKNFDNYGGRGIRVCDEWRNSFKAFYEWAMANGYENKLTVDRIDVDGDYCPENCRLITMKEQANNRRNNRLLTYEGETHTLAEWSTITGISYSAIYQRVRSGKKPF